MDGVTLSGPVEASRGGGSHESRDRKKDVSFPFEIFHEIFQFLKS